MTLPYHSLRFAVYAKGYGDDVTIWDEQRKACGCSQGKLPRPCPSEKVCVPKGMIVAEAVRVRGEDAVWGEVNGGSVELWFPGKVS